MSETMESGSKGCNHYYKLNVVIEIHSTEMLYFDIHLSAFSVATFDDFNIQLIHQLLSWLID